MKLCLLLLLGTVAACKTPAPDDGSADAAASASAGVDAAASQAPIPTDAGLAALAPATPPSLLEVVPSKLAVSSTVQNPRDFPEHLIDGKLGTAWNGRTGDLVGGWIRFQVPADAKVAYVELTAGYVRASDQEDLFTANHRITKLQVTRNGKKLGEYPLDPEQRGLQRVAIDQAGGDFELKVLETKPGTKAAWRELVVSELRVVGEPGKERRKDDDPLRIGVGKYDAFPPTLPPEPIAMELTTPYADLAALCAAWQEHAKRLLLANRTSYEQEGKPVYHAASCAEEPLGAPFTAEGAYQDVKALRLSDGYRIWSAPVVKLAAGWLLTGFEYRIEDPTDPGCPSIVRAQLVDAVSVQSGWLFFRTGSDQMTFREIPEAKMKPGNDGTRVALLAGGFWCKDAPGGLACRMYHPQYQMPLGIKVAPDWDPWAKQGWASMKWDDVVATHVEPTGELRLRDMPPER